VETIKARRLYQDEVEFATSHVLILNTNPRPNIAEVDWGTWRRLALLVFPYTFVTSKEEVTQPHHRLGDLGLKERVYAGADGQHDALVTLMVEGASRWYADPLTVSVLPPALRATTDEWRRETDRILGYWAECIEPDPDVAVRKEKMFEDFNEWLRGNGHHQWSQETFAERFGSHAKTVGADSSPMTNATGVPQAGGISTTAGGTTTAARERFRLTAGCDGETFAFDALGPSRQPGECGRWPTS
jgi:putative DNA primase/helicase